MSTAEAIKSLYELMNRDLPFEEKAQRALELGEEHLGVDNGHLTKIHPESEYWKAVSSTDPPDGEFPPDLVLDLQKTYCRRVLEREDSVALHDALDQGWADDPAFEEHELQCYHGSPLKIDEETYGTVCFVSKTPRAEPFTEDETMFAELIARLLENELRRKRADEKIERLEEFASVLAHDIRNPLAVALGRVEVAQLNHDSEHLDEAVGALGRVDDVISEVLAMARQGQHIEETEDVQLSEIANRCWATVATDQASITVEDDLTFRAAADRLQHVFENLYRNSVEHGGENVTVRVGPLPESDGFYVEDDGPGIPEDKRGVVLEAEYTTGDGSLGFGLAIVDGIATAHDWDLAITESSTGGARFEFSNVVVSSGADAATTV
jgi:K+-sensing histidine kinase KdpD